MASVLDSFMEDLAYIAGNAIEAADGSSDDEDFLVLKSFAQKVIGFRNNTIKEFPGLDSERLVFCQCGKSSEYLFCDGTHSEL